MRNRIFETIANKVEQRPGLVTMAAVFLAITSIVVVLTGNMKSETRVLDLLPDDDPAAIEYENILKQYDSASQVIIGVNGKSKEQMIRFVDAVEKRLPEITYTGPQDGKQHPFVKRSFMKMDTGFIETHGLMLSKRSDLEKLETLFSSLEAADFLEAYNNFLEMEYIEDTGAVTEREKEDSAINSLKGIEMWLAGLAQAGDANALQAAGDAAAAMISMGPQYMFSQDDQMLIAFVVPAISMAQMEAQMEGAANLRDMVQDEAAKFDGLAVRLTGMAVLGLEEMETSMDDMGLSSLMSLLLVLLLFVLAFRMWTAPLLAMINLIVGVIVTTGFIALTFGRLNLMTLMFAVILIGLGIDFAIHLNAAYAAARADGNSILESLKLMFARSGAGVVTGALTTATAFAALAFSGLEAFVELGVVLAAGIVITLISSMTTLPAMYVLADRASSRREKKGAKRVVGLEMPFLEKAGAAMNNKGVAIAVVTGVLLLVAALGYKASTAEFEADMLEMEPPDMPSVLLHREILNRFEINPDFAMLTVNDFDTARKIARRMKTNRLVGRVDTITEYLPAVKEQQRRRPVIEVIRENAAVYIEPALTVGLPGGSAIAEPMKYDMQDTVSVDEAQRFLAEMERLQLNVQEMGQMAFLAMKSRLKAKCDDLSGGENSATSKISKMQKQYSVDSALPQKLAAYQKAYIPPMAEIIVKMANPQAITLETLPDSIKERYLNADGGNLVTIYAAVDLWNGDKMDMFRNATETLSDRVTGTVVLMDRLMTLIGNKGTVATMFALAAVFLILLIDFRHLGYAFFGMIPLLLGGVMMVGLFVLLGYKFDVTNVTAIPLILGIGIDDAVHILHAVKREGVVRMPQILRHTGRALVLTSVTTAIAFGSIAFADHRGLSGMGVLLALGVGSCLFMSIVLMPALMRLVFKQNTAPSETKNIDETTNQSTTAEVTK